MFISIALSNLWRNKRRTVITELSVIFGVVVIVFTGSITYGLSLNWARRAILSFTGSMQVEHKDYEKQRKFKPLETTLTNGEAVIKRIEKYPGVTAAFGQLNIMGFISNGSKSTTFFGRGVDVEGMRKALPLATHRIGKGKPLRDNPNEVILGQKLVNNLDLKVGDTVILLVRTLKGGLNMIELIVVGVESYSGQNDYVSSHSVEMHLNTAQKLMRMSDRISQIVVAYDDFFKVPQSAVALNKELNAGGGGVFTVKDYTKLIPGYSINNFFNLIAIVVGLVLFIIVGAGIANSMFMAVMERRKEIGTMKAIGAEQGTIRQLFLMEGLIIAAIGAVLGLILSILLVIGVQQAGGVPLPPPPGSSSSISIEPVLDMVSCVYAMILALVVALIASYLPASASSKLDPVETLREE